MPYDDTLAGRVRGLLKHRKSVSEKRMFGGIAFMLGGKMCCGVIKEDFVARIGAESYPDALRAPHVRPMDFTGRPIKGYVYVGPKAIPTDGELQAWIDRSIAFTASLAEKPPRKTH